MLKDPRVKEAIGKLVRWGAQRDQVLRLVLSIPGASKEAVPLVVGIESRRLRELPDRINELSNKVKRVNESPFLAPKVLQELASEPAGYPEPPNWTATPEQAEPISDRFLEIPVLLDLYAEHLRVSLGRFFPQGKSRPAIPRYYFRMQRLLTLCLLRVVRDATGGPRYHEVETLLEAAYRVGGKAKAVDAEGLRKQEENAPAALRLIVRFLP